MGDKIAGVVLAGGKSSRMGKDKAFLDYNGIPLLDHMIGLLEYTGLRDIYVSGNFEGYKSIPDKALHKGPAYAIENILQTLKSHDGILFIPVDMPFLTPSLLEMLISKKDGAYFKNCPLPAYIKQSNCQIMVPSLRELLEKLDVPSIPLPVEVNTSMGNINTPEEWREVLKR